MKGKKGLTVLERFNRFHIKLENGCWEWQALRCSKGYGKFKAFNEQLAHRVSFILFIGPLFKKAFVCHKCDNPSCVNPDHLFMGDCLMNNRDRANKKRNNHRNETKTHCIKGHEFNIENTYYRKNGSRLCRSCERLRHEKKKLK